MPIRFYMILLPVVMMFLLGCSTTSSVKPLGLSGSIFEGDRNRAETLVLDDIAAREETFRASEEDYFASVVELRGKAAQNAAAFCKEQGKSMKRLRETTSKPPHIFIFGNNPRAELIFTCIGTPVSSVSATPAATKEPEASPAASSKPVLAEPERDSKPKSINPASFDVKYERLIKLKKLLDDGVLTQEEFNREKTKILKD